MPVSPVTRTTSSILRSAAGVIVGSFALLIMDNLGHLGAPSAIVEDVVVDPALHGCGIGRQMMEFALTKSQEKRLL